MNEVRYAHAFQCWKKVGNTRKIFQKIPGTDRAIFQKRFWNSGSDLPEKNWN